MSGAPSRRFALSLAAPLGMLLSGCTTTTPVTLVRGSLEPRHFDFVPVVRKRSGGPGGWRAACVHFTIKRATGDFVVCKVGVEMPLANADGPISTPLAQRVAADCANQAAHAVFSLATPTTPLGLACEEFKTTYEAIISRAIAGAHALKVCHAKAKPVEVSP